MWQIAAGLQAAGGVMKGIGAYQEGQFESAKLNFNARQSEIDGMIAKQNAEAEARALRKYGRQLVGQQKTRFAKSGLRLEGTPLEVMAETMENIELDAIAKRKAGRFAKAQADTQAQYQREMADRAETAGTLGLISGLLGGGSQAAGTAAMFG